MQRLSDLELQESITEKMLRSGVFKLEKFNILENGKLEAKPYEVVEIKNAFVNAGGALVLNLIIGAGGTVFSAANANIGVGDSSSSTTSGMTDLQAGSNKLRKGMDATYPSLSGQTMSWKATFGSSEANFAWNEAAIFNASSAGTMLCRATGSFGTKSSGTSWQFTYSCTVP